MAIKYTKGTDKADVELTNGHLAALEKIVKDYNLAGEKEALDFVLSLISEADGKSINNGKGSFLPAEKLKKESDATK